MMMKPYANWEEFLMPAPISIAILGELAAISSGQGDFSINLNPPKNGFKYMKYPESFSASLMQVCNTAWFAFNTANKNMDQIRLLTSQIPRANTQIVKTLSQPIKIVDAFLPKQMNSLLFLATECTNLAKAVESGFQDAIHLIQEVLEACQNSKGGYEKKLTDVKIALEQLTLREASANKSLQMAEEFKKNTQEQLQDATKAYKTAMDKIPSAWEVMGMNIVGSLFETVSTVASAVVASKTGVKIDQNKKDSNKGSAASENEVKADTSAIMSTNNICAKSARVKALADSLKFVLQSNQQSINMKLVYDEKNQKVLTNYPKSNIVTLMSEIENEAPCEAQTKVKSFLQPAIEVCEELEKAATSEGTTEMTLKNIVEKIKSLYARASQFEMFCSRKTNAPPVQVKPPQMARSGGSGAAGSEAADRAQATANMAKQQLEKTQDIYQQSFENLKKENEKLTAILVEMRSFKVEEIDFTRAKNMLIKGLDALARVREQWEKMIRFFQMISNLIESCLATSVKDLVETSKSAQTLPNYSTDDFVKDLLYNQAFKASNIANLVNMISSTYCEVSQRYLMDRVSALGRLISMNPSNPEFLIERQKLQAGCTEAQKSIQALVISKKQEFDQSVEARVNAINCQLGAAIRALPEAEKKANGEAGKEGANP
ncbi:hypothetical protein NDU88_000512 [Pleurodeles waltl]|uniref:Uncharacterized protein n=2 Tax=Pleurodeles waltl TaxID=8319 RepID=A0AAV7WFQ5_PLEWA|nr:hypothetical protein NDU88_000512 [Pleurodeles waltl]